MKLEELKRLREEKFLAHKKKKREYYLKKKEVKKVYDYEEELNNENFSLKIKEIIKAQKNYLDNRKDIIISKLNDYNIKKGRGNVENKDVFLVTENTNNVYYLKGFKYRGKVYFNN